MTINNNDYEYRVHFIEDWDGLIVENDSLLSDDDDDYIDDEEELICD